MHGEPSTKLGLGTFRYRYMRPSRRCSVSHRQIPSRKHTAYPASRKHTAYPASCCGEALNKCGFPAVRLKPKMDENLLEFVDKEIFVLQAGPDEAIDHSLLWAAGRQTQSLTNVLQARHRQAREVLADHRLL